MKSDVEVFADQLDNDWENLPTRAEAQAATKADARERLAREQAEKIADYRRRHPEAAGSDLTIALLASLEATFAAKERPA